MTNRDPEQGANQAGDESFRTTTGDLLRQSAEEIDAATASRLNRARQLALGHWPGGRRSVVPWLLPAMSVSIVATIAVGLWLNREPFTDPPVPGPAVVASAADMELLLADDSLEMLEDLDFYAWLDADLSDAELGAELESAT